MPFWRIQKSPPLPPQSDWQFDVIVVPHCGAKGRGGEKYCLLIGGRLFIGSTSISINGRQLECRLAESSASEMNEA
jgi:hypothetical protein